MPENKLLEAVASLVLQSVSVWEDLHMYGVAYSSEYNTFWGLLDENLKASVCRRREQNRKERLVPFTMDLAGYYKNILTRDSFERIGGVHWKKQLKIILTDRKFRVIMNKLNLMLEESRRSRYHYRRHTTTAVDIHAAG
jgi:hypothetical protein